MKGLGVSRGVAMEAAYPFQKQEIVIDRAFKSVEAETACFEQALEKVSNEAASMQQKARADVGQDSADILEAHLLILADSEITRPIRKRIGEGLSASAAIDSVLNDAIALFESMDDDYFRERALDYQDIKEQLLRAALGVRAGSLSHIGYDCILVADDLTPSETLSMDISRIKGIVTSKGGPNSHTAILSRMLEIPAVVGVEGLLQRISPSDIIALDGGSGEVLVNPPEQATVEWRHKQAEDLQRCKAFESYISQKCIITDKTEIQLFANINAPQDVKRALACGADGIGLFRSEFLFLERESLPSEDKQFLAYKRVLEDMEKRPVILRTLDIGGDKELPCLSIGKEDNPYLGLRAVRLCLQRPAVFKAQLRALLRASIYGNLSIMLPMVSDLEELRAAKRVLSEVKDELDAENTAYDPACKLGIMVETPSSAIQASDFAKECDFFSIGTNDLTQYTLAVDRGNQAVSHLYSHYHPAVVSLIANTIQSAHNQGILCGMCGEAAGDMRFIPLLIGLGLQEFSMNTGSLLAAKKLICSLNLRECQQLAQRVLRAATASDARGLLDEFLNRLIID